MRRWVELANLRNQRTDIRHSVPSRPARGRPVSHQALIKRWARWHDPVRRPLNRKRGNNSWGQKRIKRARRRRRDHDAFDRWDRKPFPGISRCRGAKPEHRRQCRQSPVDNHGWQRGQNRYCGGEQEHPPDQAGPGITPSVRAVSLQHLWPKKRLSTLSERIHEAVAQKKKTIDMGTLTKNLSVFGY